MVSFFFSLAASIVGLGAALWLDAERVFATGMAVGIVELAGLEAAFLSKLPPRLGLLGAIFGAARGACAVALLWSEPTRQLASIALAIAYAAYAVGVLVRNWKGYREPR